MNKEIFKLEELLRENWLPFFFNYREENRPMPFGTVPVELKNEELFIGMGPHGDAICARPAGPGDADLLNVRLSRAGKNYDAISADVAFVIMKDEFFKRRAELWPELYGDDAK